MDGLRGEDFSPDKNLAGRMIKDAKKRPFSCEKQRLGVQAHKSDCGDWIECAAILLEHDHS